jgi:hypothetical protein
MKDKAKTNKEAAESPNPEDLGLTIVERDPASLNPAVYNPRKLGPDAKKQIRTSIEKFGMVDPIIVNMHPERENTVVGGHQRLTVLKELGWPKVPCVHVNLNENDEKELNLRLNRNHGDWDYELLYANFDTDFLTQVGFKNEEFTELESDYEKKLDSITNAKAEMPIVPQYSESYQIVSIFCTNDLDFNMVTNLLKLQKAQDYKGVRVGQTLVMTADDFKTRISEITDNLAESES